MAAHILRVLNEIAEGKVSADQVTNALGYAPAADSLETSDWQELHEAAEHHTEEFIRNVAKRIMPKYVSMYFKLDCPRNCEEWRERQYPIKTVEESKSIE